MNAKKKRCTHSKPGDGCYKLVLSPRLTNTGEEKEEKKSIFYETQRKELNEHRKKLNGKQ